MLQRGRHNVPTWTKAGCHAWAQSCLQPQFQATAKPTSAAMAIVGWRQTNMNKTWPLKSDPANYDDEGNYVEHPDEEQEYRAQWDADRVKEEKE